MDENQIILIDKPAGISSFGVVAKIRGYLRAKFDHKVKVGHTGTLDPFATGLLIILTGKNTKKSDEFLKKDKVYEAELKLGYTSTTGDPEGIIEEVQHQSFSEHTRTEQCPNEGPTWAGDAAWGKDEVHKVQHQSFSEHTRPTGSVQATKPRNDGREGACPKKIDIELTLRSFLGEITQTPPRFSAIKVGGERAYKLARKNVDFKLPSRKVTIYSIDILEYDDPTLKIRTHVSSGTYIRTLAEDIGKKLGTGAYLTALRRIIIAEYDVKDAHQLSEFTNPSQSDII